MLQILAETLRIARLRIKELEAETNIQTTEVNRLKEYVNASQSAGRTMYGQQVDELKQVRHRFCTATLYKLQSIGTTSLAKHCLTAENRFALKCCPYATAHATLTIASDEHINISERTKPSQALAPPNL